MSGEQIRPEIQKFLDELRLNIAKLDNETKVLEAENKKRDALIQEKLKIVVAKDTELRLLKKQNEEGRSQADFLDEPLKEFTALEEHYKEMEAVELRKLEEAKKRRAELEALKPVSGAEKILAYHDEINRRIAELTLASRSSQTVNVAEERHQLSTTVFELEQDVEQRKQRIQKLKDELNDMETYTTTAEQRDAVTDLVNSTYKSMKTRYISSKIELAQLKASIDD